MKNKLLIAVLALVFATAGMAGGYAGYIVYDSNGKLGYSFSAGNDLGSFGKDSYKEVDFEAVDRKSGASLSATGLPQTQYVLSGNSLGNEFIADFQPAVSNYIFTGYYSDSGLSSSFDFTSPIEADTTVFAGFTEIGSMDNSDFFSRYFAMSNNELGSNQAEAIKRLKAYSGPIHISPVGDVIGGLTFYVDDNFNSSITPYVNDSDYVNRTQLYDPDDALEFVLESDLTIDSGATLTLGATLGSTMSIGLSNSITGRFFTLDLNGHNLYVNGSLVAYGIVKDSRGTGQVIASSSSSVTTDLVIVDQKTSQSSDSIYLSGDSPYQAMYLPYISATLKMMMGKADDWEYGTKFNIFMRSPAQNYPWYDSNRIKDSTIAFFDRYYSAIYILGHSGVDSSQTYVLKTETELPKTVADLLGDTYKEKYEFHNVDIVTPDDGGSFYPSDMIQNYVYNLAWMPWFISPNISISLVSSKYSFAFPIVVSPKASLSVDADSVLEFSSKAPNSTTVTKKWVASLLAISQSQGLVDSSKFTTDGNILASYPDAYDGNGSIAIAGDIVFDSLDSGYQYQMGGYATLSTSALNSVKSAVSSGLLSPMASAQSLYMTKISDKEYSYAPALYYQYPLIDSNVAYLKTSGGDSLTTATPVPSKGLYYIDNGDGSYSYYALFLDNVLSSSSYDTSTGSAFQNKAQTLLPVSFDTSNNVVSVEGEYAGDYIFVGGTFLKGTYKGSNSFTADGSAFELGSSVDFSYSVAKGWTMA